MPELAASYAVGFFVVLVLTFLAMWREEQMARSPLMTQIQENLGTLGLRFSHSRDEVIKKADDRRQPSQRRTLLIMGVFCSALSWAGLFFFLLIAVSIEKLAHKERSHLLQSPLIESGPTSKQIQSWLEENSESYRNGQRPDGSPTEQ